MFSLLTMQLSPNTRLSPKLQQKSDTSLDNGYEKNNKNTNWDPEYLCKIQGYWYNKTDLQIDLNRDTITYLSDYLILISTPLPTVYKYWCDNKPNCQLVGNGLG